MAETAVPRDGGLPARRGWRFIGGEAGGACGDLGTLLPHALAAITVVGLAPAGVLIGFGVFLIGTGAFYAMPIAVQPMKAVSAVMLTEGLSPAEVAATGVMLGVILLALGASGVLARLARLIPQSVASGLQLGLGLAMGLIGLQQMAEAPWLGALTLLLLFGLTRLRQVPAAPLALLAAIAAGAIAGLPFAWPTVVPGLHLPEPTLRGGGDWWRPFYLAVLPQLALTLTNAVILTAVLAREHFGAGANRVSERNLALSTGLANLALAPWGAMPMCHGAGGLQAHVRFGARTGLAPALLGGVLLVLGLVFAPAAADLLALVPAAAVGALLIFAGADLALTRRLFDARPACWPVILVTAGLGVLTNPAIGLAAGWAIELVQRPLARAFAARRRSRPTEVD